MTSEQFMKHLEVQDAGNKVWFSLVMWLPTVIFMAYIRKTMWRWLVMPWFHVPTITMAGWIGISFFVSTWRRNRQTKEKFTFREDVVQFFSEVLGTLITFGIAYLLHSKPL